MVEQDSRFPPRMAPGIGGHGAGIQGGFLRQTIPYSDFFVIDLFRQFIQEDYWYRITSNILILALHAHQIRPWNLNFNKSCSTISFSLAISSVMSQLQLIHRPPSHGRRLLVRNAMESPARASVSQRSSIAELEAPTLRSHVGWASGMSELTVEFRRHILCKGRVHSAGMDGV